MRNHVETHMVTQATLPRLKANMNAAVFDWDGTLAHIDDRELYCINEALQRHGVRPVDKGFYVKNYYQRAYELGTGPRMVLETAATSNKSTDIEQIYDSYRTIFRKTVEKAELQLGALELLQALKKHNFKLAVATMRFTRSVVQSELENLQVSRLIDVLLTREDLGPERTLESLEETVQKRANLVKRALTKLQSTHKDAFLVGDSWWDIRAGKRVGIKTVLVRTGFSAYNDFSKEKPEFTISSLTDLRNLLEQTNWTLD